MDLKEEYINKEEWEGSRMLKCGRDMNVIREKGGKEIKVRNG
jgi:hypothetical protein